METRRTRGKRIKYDVDYHSEIGEISDSNQSENAEDIRKSKIRDTNKEYARRMTILQTWCEYWSDYTIREGDAYPKKEALSIIKKQKKILCPIESCRKAFTTYGGLRYHYARCNIERCFKCKVCNPQTEVKTKGDLLRHMIKSHYRDLPPLDDEQKEIAIPYLSGSGRADKKRCNPNDYETQMNCRQIVKSFYDMIAKTSDPTYTIRLPFKDWLTLSTDWDLITYNTEKRRYIPPERESPHIKTSTSTWCTIRAGESIKLNVGDNSDIASLPSNHMDNVIFFTGGISTSAAWLPKPAMDKSYSLGPELIAIAVKCCSMDKSFYYKDCKDFEGCIQFWTMQMPVDKASTNIAFDILAAKPELSFMVGHGWGNIFEMCWCPLGTSWQTPFVRINDENMQISRMGLLALACGDGQIRILSVPHLENLLHKVNNTSQVIQQVYSIIESVPVFKVKPIACLSAPGAGQSTDYQTPACTTLCWNLEDNQRLLVAGYSNGNVALFDLANYSPILYSTIEHHHIYRPYKTWFAHGLPVSGVALLSNNTERTFVASGGRDRQLKIWNPMDLNTCLVSDRSPITRIVWDYRLRGIVSSTEAAFTSFQNRVSYRYPTMDGTHNTITIATHRATVWGLASSIITSSLATSDEAGEVFVALYGRPIQKRDRNLLNTHCIFTVLPKPRRLDSSQLTGSSGSGATIYYQNNVMQGYRTTIGVSDVDCKPDNLVVDDGVQGSSTGSSVGRRNIVAVCDNQVITTMQPASVDNENVDNIELELDDNNEEDVYGYAERQVANKPARFLLPMDHPAVETYDDFKHNFGLEFVDYDQKYPRLDQKLPESCLRANDVTKIYCDRVCDYPFSSIKHVSFSPNSNSFSSLLSVSHIGLCRVDKIKIIDHMYRSVVETLGNNLLQKQQN